MNSLIDGILQYSRIGRLKEEKENIDLNSLIPEVVDMIDPPGNIRIEVADNLPNILFEPTRIEQVFENLTSNAVKFMDKAEGRIAIGCTEGDEQWTFSVADNGPGIDEKYHEKIFQIFQSLKSRDEVEGTGIGLTIVKRIIDTNRGRIWVDSTVGEGTTFYFTIPKESDKGGLQT